MKTVVINFLFRILFYPLPKILISKEEENAFNHLFESSCKKVDKLITYNLAIPKIKFLYYLTKNKRIILHGSNNKEIDKFEPRQQTLYNGELATAIFATKDPIWPVFYAILDKEKIVGNIRNGSISTNGKKYFHFYSITKPTLLNKPWTTGMIYILAEDSFTKISKGAIQFNEWVSEKAVSPIAKLEIEPSDFYFLNKVAIHRSEESIVKSWLLYKVRSLIKGA
ncbi:hypothetical protein ACFFF5_11730 [Lederbergia wuyishanensis]|uniref:GIY-YIG homing endonuclease n=1 Tax=Lederbergia wuyishanensis TaxID=1347903 RepID=A0ABU0D3J9_9BACI|nr:hypothetical protein [Lederbergia wuyishanensis]MCJ8007848.1 hypothetical protein [Lederbergia wuyishanensis]MDQ0342984.1 hypothetical protein [Lederbergia wuyishanensis]